MALFQAKQKLKKTKNTSTHMLEKEYEEVYTYIILPPSHFSRLI